MFERFTDRARRVVVRAQEEARGLDHGYVGAEHLLLGLVSEGEGVAIRVLKGAGIDLDVLRTRVEEAVDRGGQAPPGHIPFAEAAKEALRQAFQEASALDHHYIGTEHVLLGVLHQGEGVAVQVLSGLGLDLHAARERVVQILDDYRQAHGQDQGNPTA
jgi:ATP-dependent Clp protease ATP-binding subunit ClpC